MPTSRHSAILHRFLLRPATLIFMIVFGGFCVWCFTTGNFSIEAYAFHMDQPQRTYAGPAYEDSGPTRTVYGTELYLQKGLQDEYVIVDSEVDEGTVSYWDKSLTWDYAFESFYDEEDEVYLWYNPDVNPATWQYWYEGISSDFDEYGWMEYNDGWWIEVTEGKWVPLPSEYDTAALWHIG